MIVEVNMCDIEGLFEFLYHRNVFFIPNSMKFHYKLLYMAKSSSGVARRNPIPPLNVHF